MAGNQGNWELAILKNDLLFESAILIFFSPKKWKNFASSLWKFVPNYVLEWMGLNFYGYDNTSAGSVLAVYRQVISDMNGERQLKQNSNRNRNANSIIVWPIRTQLYIFDMQSCFAIGWKMIHAFIIWTFHLNFDTNTTVHIRLKLWMCKGW